MVEIAVPHDDYSCAGLMHDEFDVLADSAKLSWRLGVVQKVDKSMVHGQSI
jgi:hypothetical protein